MNYWKVRYILPFNDKGNKNGLNYLNRYENDLAVFIIHFNQHVFWSTSVKLNKSIYVGVCEIRTKLEPFVHIHNGDILHKSLPGFRKGFMKNDTIANMHQSVQLSSDRTNPYVKLFSFKISTPNPRHDFFPGSPTPILPLLTDTGNMKPRISDQLRWN